MTKAAALPTEPIEIKMDPDLARAVRKILEEVSPKDLDRAKAAVLEVYKSGAMGAFSDLVDQYRDAILAAVA